MDIHQQLEDTKQRTLHYFDTLSPAELDLNRGAGTWTVREILHHLADTETVLYDRIRRVIAEPRGVIWAFDQAAWARELGYANMPVAVSRGVYAGVREGVIYQARLHYASKGHLEFVHSEAGVKTLAAEFEKIAWHNERHLAQIAEALAS